MSALLITLLALPMATAVAILLLAPTRETVRWFALVGAVSTLLAAMGLAGAYYPSAAQAPKPVSAAAPIDPTIVCEARWLSYAGAEGADPTRVDLLLGLDGVSMALMLLTALLTISCVLISWESISERAAEFYAAMLILETGMLGVFAAFDLVSFYVFFEFTLIPLFFLIAIWGGPQRRYAAVKFFLYTLAGSLISLLGLVMLVTTVAADGLTTPCSLPDLAAWLQAHPLDRKLQVTLFLMLSVGFLVKTPVFPLHTWLPLAHTEAPTAGSVLLAGVLLKLGTYGFLRLCLPLFPEACVQVGLPLVAVLSVVGVIYGSLCALAQRDVKKLVAYSSVAHMGFCTLGLFALNTEGLTGGVLQMINHGLSTGGLFLLVGMIYDRYHTRMLDDLGGLANRLPLIAAMLVFISMASVGLPGLNGFIGEALCLFGMFKREPIFAVLGATGVVLGAWYLLGMLQSLLFGELREPPSGGHTIKDLGLREFLAIAPIAAACLWIGVRPQPLIDSVAPDLERVAAVYADPAAGGPAVAVALAAPANAP